MKLPKHIRLILSKAGVDWKECRVEITKGTHIRLFLPNGLSVACACSPSDYRGSLNKASEIRRLMRTNALPH